jgi:hypothetical protein
MLRFAGVLLVAAMAATAHAQQADLGSARAKELKDGIKTFQLKLLYQGDEDKPFYRLTLSVPPIDVGLVNPFDNVVQINEELANEIIDYLARDGFLTKAVDRRNKIRMLRAATPSYTLSVGNFSEDLGWRLPMLKRLDGLRKILDGDAAKGMDRLLARLSGLRKQWEKDAVVRPKA